MAKRSRSTAHIVDLIAEGAVGPAINDDWEYSMYFQETQLRFGANADDTNFDGASVVGITGAAGPQAISDFASSDKVENTVLVNTEITHAGGSVSRSITDTNVDDVDIAFEAPNGLVYVSEKGKWYDLSVKFRITITPDGGSETDAKYHTMSNETTSPYRTSITVDNLTTKYGAGPWVIKIYRLTQDYVSSKNGSYADRTDWYSYTEVKRVKMQYRNRAVVATTLVAEDFGDNIPNRALKVKRLDLQYPNNYDPTKTYEDDAYTGIWDGDFVRGVCSNPAWVVYDICNNKRFGIGLEELNLDKWKLYEIAQWCDGEVVYNVDVLQSDGTYTNTPITQKRFTANGAITDRQQALVVVNHLCSIFRGFPLWQAGLISFEYDVPDDVSRVASEANVIGGFVYEGTSSENQHNAIKITYNNPDMFGKQDSIIIENRDAIRLANNEYNLLELYAPLCTDRNEAILRAKYALYTDINQTELCRFKGGLEWADCLPGEIIAIQDPYYVGERLGGRITSSTTTSITIDSPITIASGTYTLYLQQNTDNVVIKTLTNSAGSTSTLTWSGVITAPQKNNVWVVSTPSKPARKFRVLSIKESSNITFDIQCYEYDANKYSLVESNQYIEAPPPQTFLDGLLSPPSNLSAEAMSYLNSDGGGRKYGAALSWTGSVDPRTEYYEVRYRFQDGIWTQGVITVNTGYFVEDLSAGSYDFGVRAKGLTSSSKWITALDLSITTSVSGVQPPSGLRVYGTVSGTQWSGKDCHIEWDATDVAVYNGTTTTGVVSYYKIDVRKADTTLLRSWTSASKYETDFIYTYEMNMEDNAGVPIRNPLFYAYSVDIYDITSTTYSTLSSSNPAPNMSSTLPVNTFYPTGTGGYVKVSWAANSDLDMSKYTVYFDSTNPPVSGAGSVLHPINQAEMFNLSDGVSYYSKIVPYDLFGVGIESQVSNAATANFSAIDIENELRDSITITTDATYSGTLSGIYDQIYNSGGITIANPDGKYIEYYFKIEQYINLSNIWSANANPRVYIGYSSDAITWNYLKAEADHTLDSTGRLVAATNQADAITNYWQLAAGPNKAEWTNNLIARYVRVYFVNTNATNIYELQHRRMVLAEDVVTDTLSAIVANAGTINAGLLQSTNYSSSIGFKVDLDAAEMYLGGSATPVMKFYYDSGNKLDITASVVFRSGSSGYTNISDKPTSLSGINATEGSNLTTITGWQHPSDITKIDGGDVYVGSQITIGSSGHLKIGATAYATGTGIWIGDDGGTYKARIGTTAGNRITWDGTTLYVSGQVIIGASSSGYANMSDKPTTLSGINTTEGSKLTGIAAGATVGATWGTNLSNIPATLGTPAGSGLFLSSTNMGYYTAGAWKTYIDSSGNMILGDIAGGGSGLSWNQGTATLSIKGSIVITNTIPAGSVSGLAATATSTDFSNITGATKPANNATVGATWGVNIGSQPTLGTLAALSAISASNCDTTIISGGKIITGLLTASNIQAGTLYCNLISVVNLSASSINTGSLNAGYITSGTLNCGYLSVINLNASSIIAGTITTDRLIGGAITSYGQVNTAGSVAVAYLGAGTAVQSFSFYTTGGPLTISAGCRVHPSGTSGVLYSIALARGGTTSAYFLAQSNAQTYPATTFPAPYNSSGEALTYSEQLGAGTYTYYLMADANFTGGTATNRFITVTEHKR